jgi:hypothetical protein
MANSASSHACVRALLLGIAMSTVGRAAAAQTDYYHLDASRPIRIEDASVVDRYALEIEAPSIRAERTTDGVYRYRSEPHVSFGILPRTQVEIGAPMEYRDAPGRSYGGLVGVSIAGMHNFNNESRLVPALALWAGVKLPIGALSSNTTRIGVKGIATRSFTGGRLHVNAEYSTAFKTSTCTSTPDVTCAQPPPDQFTDTGNCFKISSADFSCAAMPTSKRAALPNQTAVPKRTAVPSLSVAGGSTAAAAAGATPRGRWAGGVAVDHAFPLRSLLIAAGAFVEHEARAGALMEVTAETGARLQLAPRTVLDGGVGRHFTGSDQSWFIMAGLSFELGVPGWMRGS